MTADAIASADRVLGFQAVTLVESGLWRFSGRKKWKADVGFSLAFANQPDSS